MLRSLYAGISGLDVNQKSMDVIGNNIANVNTIGFKGSRAVFQDLLSQTLVGGKAPTDARGGVNPRQVGSGSFLAGVDNIFGAGTLQTTARNEDLAIQGNGFFALRGEGENQMYYSRAGDFNFDRFGNLVNPAGYKVQGWMADPNTGEIETDVDAGDVAVGAAYQTMQARETSEVQLAGVLDTRAKPSIQEYKSFLSYAESNEDIFSLYTESGFGLDLSDGEPVRIKAHATSYTDVADTFNSSDLEVSLSDGDAVTMYVNNVAYSFTYRTSADNTVADTEFSTMGGFLQEIQTTLAGLSVGTTATIDNNFGQISLQAGATGFAVNSFSGNAVLTSILNDLTGTYGVADTKSSDEFNFVQEIKAGQDFDDLSTLASEIRSAMNSNIVAAGDFGASFINDEFDLNDGDTVTVTISAVPYTLTYRDNPAVAGEFNSLVDFGAELNAATPVGVTVSVDPLTRELTVNNTTGGAITVDSVTTTGADTFFTTQLFNELGAAAAIPNATSQSTNELKDRTGTLAYYHNDTSGDNINITGFEIDKAYSGRAFEDNMVTTSTIGFGNVEISNRFLADAEASDLVEDLYGNNGRYLGLFAGSNIELASSVDGEVLTGNNTISVANTTTLDDFMTSIEEYLGLGDTFNDKENVQLIDGKLTVTGEKGKANAIDYLTIQMSGNNVFNEYMESNVVQAASGGQLVTNQIIYDEQGNPHTVSYNFELYNDEDNEWKLTINTENPDDSVNINGTTDPNTVYLSFNQDGSFNYFFDPIPDPDNIITNVSLRFTPGNGANTIDNIDVNLGTQGEFDGMFLSAEASSINLSDQDGYALGSLERTLFNPAGEISGYYTNGEVRTIGQIALALFTNNQGLLKVGDTMFAATANSGDAAIGKPQAGFRGDIASGALENSNVDMSREFVSMITSQRGFQANSRVITTSDEMLQELLNLKR